MNNCSLTLTALLACLIILCLGAWGRRIRCGRTLYAAAAVPNWRENEPLSRVEYVNALDSATCRDIINEATKHPWQTARHSSYPTTDIATSTVPRLELMLLSANTALIERACQFFGFEPEELWLRDQFVVKYEPNAQNRLDPHRDASPISYVIALNEEYSGGGTAFRDGPAGSRLVPRKLKVGEAILFSGKRLHEGLQIDAGIRYIVTGFLDAHASKSTAEHVSSANPISIEHTIGRGNWSLGTMIPTRPYLRHNTYRILGKEAAQRGDVTLMTRPAELAARWPHAILSTVITAAVKVARNHGTALGEERLHTLFHHFLTSHPECKSAYCHMAS